MTGQTGPATGGRCALTETLSRIEEPLSSAQRTLRAVLMVFELNYLDDKVTIEIADHLAGLAIGDVDRVVAVFAQGWREMRVAHGLPADPPAGDLTETRPCTCMDR